MDKTGTLMSVMMRHRRASRNKDYIKDGGEVGRPWDRTPPSSVSPQRVSHTGHSCVSVMTVPTLYYLLSRYFTVVFLARSQAAQLSPTEMRKHFAIDVTRNPGHSWRGCPLAHPAP